MSKITNDDLTRSGTGCFTAVPIWQLGIKGLNLLLTYLQLRGCLCIGLSDSAVDDGHVTSKSVPVYCDVIDDNTPTHCHHQLYHHHPYQQHHQHWTIAPPPPSYSSAHWDTPLQPSAPDPAASRCHDDAVTSRTHYVVDSAATIGNQEAIHSSGDSLAPATCPQCRRQRPVCV